MIALTLAGLLLVLRLEQLGGGSPVLPVALLIVGTNGITAIVPPTPLKAFRCACAAGRPGGSPRAPRRAG